MEINREKIRLMCKKLNLHNIANIPSFDIEFKTHLEYFKYLLDYEINNREAKLKKHNRGASHLPKIKTRIEYKNVNEWNVERLKTLSWYDNDRNLIIVGKCGKGKTQLACILGEIAIDRGLKVYYFKVDKLIRVIRNADGFKEQLLLTKLKEMDLIIIDEVLYLPIPEQDIILLYRYVMSFCEVSKFIMITNRQLDEWESTIDDKHTMETFVDRLKNNSNIIVMK